MSLLRKIPVLLVLSTSLLVACGSQRLPPGHAPTPETITKDEPGGDAYDPHEAALMRQVDSSWGWRTDKDGQVRFPLPDRHNWTRVRFMFVNHFTAFKYGDDHHTIAAAFIVPLQPEDARTSAVCLQRFEEKAFSKASAFGGVITNLQEISEKWKEEKLVVHEATGEIDILFKHIEVALTWTAYPAYPNSCLAITVAVPWRDHQALAEKVRDKWTLGFPYFHPLTEGEPFRH